MATLTRQDRQVWMSTPNPRFNERKSTEAAAMLVDAFGRRIGLDRLMMLLYIIDRRLIDSFGRGLTDDDYTSLPPLGAVPTALTVHALEEGLFGSSWHRHLELVGDYVKLLAQPDGDELADVERDVVKAVVGDYAGLEWDDFLAKYLQEAPEARRNEQEQFNLADVLTALGENKDDATAAYAEFDSWRNIRYGPVKQA